MLHAKFGVVTDRQGDSIAFMGSGNETGQAITQNYEELVVGWSWEDPGFTDRYRARFEALWEGNDPDVAVVPLPEAVRQKLIRLAPSEPPKGEPRPDVKALKAAMRWHFIAAAPYLPNGEAACDATMPVDLWPHQRRVVEDTARAFPAGRLLCDEVGMGKTIEAIAVLRRLLAGRGVRRALLLVPAGLMEQWQSELREKGGLLVPRWKNGILYLPEGGSEPVEAGQALRGHDLLLLSREWARLSNNRELVLTAPEWDLVLMDEAHAARRLKPEEGEFNSGNLLLELLRELQLRRRTRGILLLSATPMQTQPWEPWDLLATLGVGGKWQVDFADIRAYYEGIEALRNSTLLVGPKARAIARLVVGDEEFPDPRQRPRSSVTMLKAWPVHSPSARSNRGARSGCRRERRSGGGCTGTRATRCISITAWDCCGINRPSATCATWCSTLKTRGSASATRPSSTTSTGATSSWSRRSLARGS